MFGKESARKRRAGRVAGVLTAAFLAASCAADNSAPEVSAVSASETPRRQVTVSYMEPASYSHNTMLDFTHHAPMVAAMLDWGSNGNYTVSWYDLDPFELTEDIRGIIRHTDVLAISLKSYSYSRAYNRLAWDAFWEVDNGIAVLATGNDSNSAHPERYDKKARERILAESYNPFTRGDTVLRIGQTTNGKIAANSSENSPDLVFPTTFESGFCYDHFYFRQNEIDAFLKGRLPSEITHWTSYFGAAFFKERPDARKPLCAADGTSFSGPNVARLLARFKAQYPALDSYELVATALLSAQPVDVTNTRNALRVANGYVTRNACGFVFDSISGFGLYDPGLHERYIQDLLMLKGSRPALKSEHVLIKSMSYKKSSDMPGKNLESYALDVQEQGIILRSIAEIRLAFDAPQAREFAYAYSAPPEVYLQSPAGTRVRLAPVRVMTEENGQKMIVLGADTSAFFGEQTEGEWTVSFPQIKKPEGFQVSGVDIAHWGMKPGNPVEALIRQIHRLPMTASKSYEAPVVR